MLVKIETFEDLWALKAIMPLNKTSKNSRAITVIMLLKPKSYDNPRATKVIITYQKKEKKKRLRPLCC